MNSSAGNSSSPASAYFWSECDPYDVGGAGRSGRPSLGLLILVSTSCFEFLTGVPSNLWLVCHILGQRSKVAGILPADFFLLHLALAQLCFYLSLPIFGANHLLWRSNDVLAVVTLLNSMMLVMKPLLLCLVCVERYMAVVRPLHYLRLKARRYRWGCLAVSWCIYIIMMSAALLKRSVTALCVVFLPALVIDSFCSLSILQTLKKTPPGDREVMEKKMKKKKKREEERETPKNRSGTVKKEEPTRGRRAMNSMKNKAFITTAIIQVALTLNYLPIIITLPLDGRVPARTLKCQYMAVGIAAADGWSYLQPLLYLYRLGRLPCTSSPNT